MAIGTAAPLTGFGKFALPSTLVRGAVDKIFKEFYLPAVRDILNSKRILTRYIRRNTQDISGNQAVIALNIGRNEGLGFIGEQGKLPDPGRQSYENATYQVRYNYGRILFTGPAVASSRNERGAFIRIMDAEIKGMARDLQHENNRVMFGDGGGVIAVQDGAPVGAVLTMKDPGGFTNTGPGTQYLRPGMMVSMLNSGGTAARASSGSAGIFAYKILTVDTLAGTITVDNGTEGGAAGAPASSATGDLLVRASERSTNGTANFLIDSGYKNEAMGLAGIINEGAGGRGDLGNVDASTVAQWNAAVIDNGGVPVPFNQDMFQQGMDHLDVAGDGTVQMWMTTHGIRRQYLTTLVANKRYVNTMELDGGFKALEYDGLPIVIDKDCTRGRIYGLDLETLHLFSETDYQWMDADGSILERLPNHDAYQATLYRYWELGTDARNRNLVIKDIEDV